MVEAIVCMYVYSPHEMKKTIFIHMIPHIQLNLVYASFILISMSHQSDYSLLDIFNSLKLLNGQLITPIKFVLISSIGRNYLTNNTVIYFLSTTPVVYFQVAP